jgi:hypothetical protein
MTSKEYKKVISFILNDLDTRDQLKLMTLVKEKLQLNEETGAAKHDIAAPNLAKVRTY